jgi:hypothetical protein
MTSIDTRFRAYSEDELTIDREQTQFPIDEPESTNSTPVIGGNTIFQMIHRPAAVHSSSSFTQ